MLAEDKKKGLLPCLIGRLLRNQSHGPPSTQILPFDSEALEVLLFGIFALNIIEILTFRKINQLKTLDYDYGRTKGPPFGR